MPAKKPLRSGRRRKRDRDPSRFPFGLLSILNLMGGERTQSYREQSARSPYRIKMRGK